MSMDERSSSNSSSPVPTTSGSRRHTPPAEELLLSETSTETTEEEELREEEANAIVDNDTSDDFVAQTPSPDNEQQRAIANEENIAADDDGLDNKQAAAAINIDDDAANNAADFPQQSATNVPPVDDEEGEEEENLKRKRKQLQNKQNKKKQKGHGHQEQQKQRLPNFWVINYGGTWTKQSPARAARPLQKLRRLMVQRTQCALKFLRLEFRHYVERSFRPLGTHRLSAATNGTSPDIWGNRKRCRAPGPRTSLPSSLASSCASSSLSISASSSGTNASPVSTIVSSGKGKSKKRKSAENRESAIVVGQNQKQQLRKTTSTYLASALAQRIQRRALQSAWLPLPRLPAFRCPKCGLSSRRLQLLQRHLCSRKRPAEYKNVDLTIELGFRSRVKDALAVLERHPRPQAVRVQMCKNVWPEWEREPMAKQPKLLRDIAWACVLRMHGLDRNVQLIQTKAPHANNRKRKNGNKAKQHNFSLENVGGIGTPTNQQTSQPTETAAMPDDHDYGWQQQKRGKEAADSFGEKEKEGQEQKAAFGTLAQQISNGTDGRANAADTCGNAAVGGIGGKDDKQGEASLSASTLASGGQVCPVTTWCGGRKRMCSSSVVIKRHGVIVDRRNIVTTTGMAGEEAFDNDGVQLAPEKQKKQPKRAEHQEVGNNGKQFVTSPDGIAFYCRRCSCLFARYMDWDAHLRDDDDDNANANADGGGSCTALSGGEEPMQMQVLLNEKFPTSGRHIRIDSTTTVKENNGQQQQQQWRQKQLDEGDDWQLFPSTASLLAPATTNANANMRKGRTENNMAWPYRGGGQWWRCTKCATSGFVSRTEFHAHLLKCALLMDGLLLQASGAAALVPKLQQQKSLAINDDVDDDGEEQQIALADGATSGDDNGNVNDNNATPGIMNEGEEKAISSIHKRETEVV